MSRVRLWYQRGKFVQKPCHRKSSLHPKYLECDFDTKEENLLENHFTENHSLSSVFLKRPVCDFDTKEENSCKECNQKRINNRKNKSKSYLVVASLFPCWISCSGLSQRSQSTDSNQENGRNFHRSGSSYSDSKNQRNLHHSLKEVILVHPKHHVPVVFYEKNQKKIVFAHFSDQTWQVEVEQYQDMGLEMNFV